MNIVRASRAVFAAVRIIFLCSSLAPLKSMASENRQPREVPYEKATRLRGVSHLEYDMSAIDSDLSPVRDLQEVRRQAAIAKKSLPPDLWWRLEPRPHLILRLDHPITVTANNGLSFPREENVREIDFGPPRRSGPHGGRVTVIGQLWHACTVHHLRAVMGDVISAHPVRKHPRA